MNSAENQPRLPLRVGLLVDSFTQPRWIEKIVRDIQSSGFAEVCLVIKNEYKEPLDSRARIRSYWKNRNYLLYAFYNRLDRHLVKPSPDAFDPFDIRELILNCPVLPVIPTRKRFSDWFTDDHVNVIQKQQLDVALAFGFRILKGRALQIAKHGVWSYHHGDNLINRGGPAGFWEVMERSAITGSVLQRLNEDLDNGFVIHRSWSSTSDRFSVKANKNTLYWRSTSYVIRALKELHEAGEIVRDESRMYRPYHKQLYKIPTNAELFPKLATLSLDYLSSKLRNAVSLDQWTLAYRFRTSIDDPNNTFYRFHHVTPPKDRFWADPFPVVMNGKYYLFFEEFIYKTNLGHIVVAEVDRSSKPQTLTTQVALKKEYHLSYPFIFSWQGRLFMIPETASKSTVELYSCRSFPSDWKLEAILMENVNAKDATVVEANGLWWMFVLLTDTPFADELHIFYAETPLGPWTSHRQNPITSDIRNLRPAGKPFIWQDQMYRPAQDCSRYYGYAVTINRILKLSPDEFAEEQVSKVLPLWRKDVLATHTLNISNDLTVVDCLMRRRK